MKRIWIALIFILFYSGTDKFPEPVWYEINFNDGVTHLWHRSVLYDTELFENVQDSLGIKYKGKSKTEIEIESIEVSLKLNRIKRQEKVNLILNE